MTLQTAESTRAGGRMISVGQEWRHVGGGGVAPTGLLVRIEEIVPGGFLASYPESGRRPGRNGSTTRLVFYRGCSLGERYVLESET